MRVLLQQKAPVRALAYSPDGTLLAGGDTVDLQLWRLPDGASEGEFNLPAIEFEAAAFSSDGLFLAASGQGVEGPEVVEDQENGEEEAGRADQ